MTFDYPVPEQLPLLKQLWKTAFGDSEEYLHDFFNTAFSPLRCRVAMEKGSTIAALYWFETVCRERKLAYLYAVATCPEHRGRGVCRRLMADTQNLLRQQDYAGVLLVPETAPLREMYASFGYRSCTRVSETFCAAAGVPVPLHRIDREEYARLRREFLPEGAVVQEGENLRFLETQARLYRGADFLLAARPEGEDSLFGMELLGSAAAAPGILQSLGYAQGTFRTPGTKKDFAMFLPLTECVPEPAYFGLAFD